LDRAPQHHSPRVRFRTAPSRRTRRNAKQSSASQRDRTQAQNCHTTPWNDPSQDREPTPRT
jgi:hypothetical protein